MQLNKTPLKIRARRGVFADIAAAYIKEGEIVYTTDDKQLYVGDADNNFNRVHGLDLAVMNNDILISNNDEIVYTV